MHDQNNTMAEDENNKTKHTHEVSIALIQKDIQYMRESMGKIELAVGLIDKNFARKEELINLEKAVQDMAKAWEKKVDDIEKSKVSHDDFDPIKKTLGRINWLVITAVVVGLLALIIKVP